MLIATKKGKKQRVGGFNDHDCCENIAFFNIFAIITDKCYSKKTKKQSSEMLLGFQSKINIIVTQMSLIWS